MRGTFRCPAVTEALRALLCGVGFGPPHSCLEIKVFGDATTLKEISQILGIPVNRLQAWADQENDDRYTMRVVTSHKGKARRVADPKPELKKISRAFRMDLLQKAKVLKYSHGFVSGRGQESNAKEHEHQPVVWKVDIANAFGSVSRSEIQKDLERLYSPKLAEVFSGWVCRNGWLVPGNPAAPDIFNVYTVPLIVVLASLAKLRGLRFSAYADDFYFSGENIGPKFRATIVEMLSRWNFKAHEFGTAKNRLMVQGKDPVIITGLRLTQDGEVRLPRPVFGEATRLVKELKRGAFPTERIWLSRPRVGTGGPEYEGHRTERELNSTIGFLQYCYRHDSHFRAWSERQLSAPEHSHILATILGRKEAERRGLLLTPPEPLAAIGATAKKAVATPKRKAQGAPISITETMLDEEAGATVSDLLRIWQVEKALGVSKSTIYRMMRKGEFPACVQISENTVGWREDEVRAWLANRKRGMV